MLVRLTAAYKSAALANPDNAAHVAEFGACVGEVVGPTDWGVTQGPEVDVRWLPSGLRYSYDLSELEEVAPPA